MSGSGSGRARTAPRMAAHLHHVSGVVVCLSHAVAVFVVVSRSRLLFCPPSGSRGR